MTTASLLWGLLFSSIGVALFIYGKRQAAPVPLISGVALMVYPFFISNTTIVVIVGLALSAVPYMFRM